MKHLFGILGLSAFALASGGCGGEEQTAPPPAAPHAVEPPPAPPLPPAQPPTRAEAAHNLTMLAAACWFGGVWGDAEGDTLEMRAQASEARCHDVIRRVYGHDDKDHYEQLRAYEASVVGDVAAKVQELAKDDPDDAPRAKVLGELVQNVAAAQREAMLARRSAARVRRDLDHEPDKLTDDEASAVEPLRDTRALATLLAMQAGDITHDAHALGILAAIERLQSGLDLPKHMKIFAVGGANKLVFGVEPPLVADDSSKRLKPGTWLAYITDVAKAAGHPVPDSVKLPKQREPLAWAGVLDGYADKIRADQDGLAKDTRLAHVVAVVAARFEAEYRAVQNALTGPPAQKNPKAPAAAPAPKHS